MKRPKIPTLSLGLTALLLIAASSVSFAAGTPARPNVLFIFSDDHAPGRHFQHGSKAHVHFTCVVMAALAHVSFMSGAELSHRAGLLQVRKDAHVGQG